MPKLITKDNHIRKKYELSATKDTVISLNNPQDVVINGSQAQAIGVIKRRYYNYFVLCARRYAPITVNGESVASHNFLRYGSPRFQASDKTRRLRLTGEEVAQNFLRVNPEKN